MPFHVIRLDTKEPVMFAGMACAWDTGEAAARAAESFTINTGVKHKPQRVKGDPEAWKKRESLRFTDGVYTRLPWYAEAWYRGSIGETAHFAHVSKEKPGMIAFTESEEKGEADIRTRIKAGTYLERFYCDVLTPPAIQKYARDFAGKYETNGLKYATTEDEIAHVYINGPRSCMSGPEKGLYASPCHPSRAYAGGDLAVAYMERGGGIIARSVVWPDKKIHSSIYGDYDRMEPALRKAGFKNGQLVGAKLKRILFDKNGTKFLVVPHIDHTGRITDHGDHLTIGGPCSAASTNGIIHAPVGTQCTRCKTWGHDKARMQTTADMPSSLYCATCFSQHTYLCRATNVRYGDSSRVWLMTSGVNGGANYYWTREHFRKHGAVCNISGGYFPKDEVTTLGDGRICANRYLKEHAFTCTKCKKQLEKRNHYYSHGVCHGCRPRSGTTGGITSSGTTSATLGSTSSYNDAFFTLQPPRRR